MSCAYTTAGTSTHPIPHPSDLRSILADWILSLVTISATGCARTIAVQGRDKIFIRGKGEVGRKLQALHFSPFLPFPHFTLCIGFLYFPRAAIVRAHLGAAVISGKEAKAATMVRWRQKHRILRSVQVPAEIHTGLTKGWVSKTGAALKRACKFKTTGHARPAFLFV